MNLRSTTFLAFVTACGARTEHPSTPPPPPSAIERFVDALRKGHSLYGVGTGCDEWRAQPDGTETVDDEDAGEEVPEAGDDVQTEVSDEPAPPPKDDASWLEGSLMAHADQEGRIYQLEYQVNLAKAPLRMKIIGRGGWYPAPGVVIRGADGNAIIGVGRYCISEVEVRADPEALDAVLVGKESWFLTQDACVRSTRSGQGRHHSPQGCSK